MPDPTRPHPGPHPAKPSKKPPGSGAIAEFKPTRSFAQALRALESLPNFERLRPERATGEAHFKLDRMRALAQALGSPHEGMVFVHVAGSKGKGSVVEMLAASLTGCGYGVGVYTSPHLVGVRERIRVNEAQISESDFVKHFNAVIAAAAIVEPEFGPATYFEAVTAMALRHFAEQAVDLAVLEVGLGGRLDATNIVTPAVACVAQIQLEHTQILGTTLGAIAREKAGIFKAGVPAITVPQSDESIHAMREVAEAVGAPFAVLGRDIEFNQRFESDAKLGPHMRVGLATPRGIYEHLPVPLPGDHQALNCGLALAALDQLRAIGFDAPEVRVAEGLARTRRDGRAELIWTEPRIIADGAHTPDSVAALVRAIGAHTTYDSMVVVFGCASDKDIDGLLVEISRGADKIVFTKSGANPRAADPEMLRNRYTELTGKMAQVEPDVKAAINTAARAVGKDDLVCVTGSFYIAGEAKKLFEDKAREQVGV